MKLRINAKDLRAKKSLSLKNHTTCCKLFYKSKEEYEKLIACCEKDLGELQELLFADGRKALLIIFQGMDAAGKDGAIKHVMSGINPQGCQVYSFKQPTPEELSHDFLWRTTKVLPERGRIGIFNRSYYEEVVVVRVHPKLLEKERMPKKFIKDNSGLWKRRYRDISHFEKYLFENGTTIIKFFLHISKTEQKKRVMARINDEDKIWKFSPLDIAESRFWKDYMRAYEDCIRATNRKHAPWYIIPADEKKNARLMISKVIIETIKHQPLSYPAITPDQRIAIKLLKSNSKNR